jgi:cyclopropane fatty-acyl-phospholipid synthase-like methyltransferase
VTVNDYGRQLSAAEIAAKEHREFVGGLWDEIGALQLEFMKSRGLSPSDNLLDVGCGALRGGVHFVRYLDPGRYHGIDVNASLIEAGRQELAEAQLQSRNPQLLVSDSFAVDRFATRFGYALAVSVFTHLNMNLIARCLASVRAVLEPGGRFYGSYFEAPASVHGQPLRHASGIVTYYANDPYHYSVEEMRALAQLAGLVVERIGNWGHPRGQTMLAFSRA